MSETQYEVVVWYEVAPSPDNITDREMSHAERERFDSKEELVDWLQNETRINVDDVTEAGTPVEGRRSYGYWSMVPDRQTGKKWYEWAEVEVRKLEIERENVNEIMDDEDKV